MVLVPMDSFGNLIVHNRGKVISGQAINTMGHPDLPGWIRVAGLSALRASIQYPWRLSAETAKMKAETEKQFNGHILHMCRISRKFNIKILTVFALKCILVLYNKEVCAPDREACAGGRICHFIWAWI